MLNIKTAKEAREEWIERAEKEVEKRIQEAQEQWETECYFFSPLPISIIKQLRKKGYVVTDEGMYVSWR